MSRDFILNRLRRTDIISKSNPIGSKIPTSGERVFEFESSLLALKSSPEELKEKFYANMSQRAKEAFVEEMQFLGAVKVKEVEGAQRKIVDAVQALAEQGVLQLGESEEMIE